MGAIIIFFFISKNFIQKSLMCIKYHSKQNYKGKSEESNAKEAKKSPTEGEQERPQARDESNREP